MKKHLHSNILVVISEIITSFIYYLVKPFVQLLNEFCIHLKNLIFQLSNSLLINRKKTCAMRLIRIPVTNKSVYLNANRN